MLAYTPTVPRVEIYPREGTETFFNLNITGAIALKFIPVRGRKRELLILKAVFAVLKFIPVRGRKLQFLSDEIAIVIVEIYPREGTETFRAFHFLIVFC